jgi:hypothetical protein
MTRELRRRRAAALAGVSSLAAIGSPNVQAASPLAAGAMAARAFAGSALSSQPIAVPVRLDPIFTSTGDFVELVQFTGDPVGCT